VSVIRRGPLAADNFTIVSNAIIRDARLSLKARGLGIWLLSHTEGWKLSIRSIATQVGTGVEAVQSGLKELEDHGYLVREQQTGEHGKFAGVDYRVTDVPAGQTEYGFPVHGSPADGEAGDRVSDTHKKTNSKKIKSEEEHPAAGAIQKALDYIAENHWTLTAERLRNTLEGGPRPASRPAPSRPSTAARVVGNQILEF
jgi:hypothetical protein